VREILWSNDVVGLLLMTLSEFCGSYQIVKSFL